MHPLALSAIGVVVLYQLTISAFVLRAIEYEPRQKTLQLCLVWFLPVIGAAIAHVFLWSHRTPPMPQDRNFTPQDHSDVPPLL